jgi:PAS domain S-box-containing protein
MDWHFNGESADIEQALAGGAPQRVGWFRFYFSDQRWEWSDQVQRIHGYEPGTVTPTTELVLSHKHPDDRGEVAATIDDILNTHKPFSTRHRIVDLSGAVHHVIVAGDRLIEQGEVVGTYGFYIDVSRQHDPEHEEMVTAKLAEIAESRAAIEQTKGMLMLVYGIDEDTAFNLLKWLSQEANIKLRQLAEQISVDFRDAGLTSQSEYDQLLLTARLRVSDSP